MSGRERGLSIRGTFREIFTIYREQWRFLIPAAIVILLPQGLVDAVLDGFNVEGINSAKDVALIGGALLTIAVNLGGQAFYSGLTAAAVVDWEAGLPLPPLRKLIRALPIGRLILLDVVVSIGAAVGFVLFVLPGLLFLSYVGVAAAVLKLEHLGIWQSMKRSVQLVRGHLWPVFVLVVGVTIVTELVVELISAPFHGLPLVAGVNLAADGLVQPIEGLAIAIVAIRLLELRGEAPAPDVMARSLVSERD
jgi:hypothetical protein